MLCIIEIETYLPGVSYLLKKAEQADKKGLDDKLASIGIGQLVLLKNTLERRIL